MIRQTNVLKQYSLEPNNEIFKKYIYEILSLLEKENNVMLLFWSLNQIHYDCSQM